MAQLLGESCCQFHDVWRCNLWPALSALGTVLPGAVVALDVEFPGCLRRAPCGASRGVQHEVMRNNVNVLQPIQLGLAVSGTDGELRGVWTFNIHFDETVHLHNEESLAFLRAAGVDLRRHAAQGIDRTEFGMGFAQMLTNHRTSQVLLWVTFAGLYDLGYFLKVLTNQPLPTDVETFETALRKFCSSRFDLRAWLPHGSLASLAEQRGLIRYGVAHTAGSDALLTLQLFHSIAQARGHTWAASLATAMPRDGSDNSRSADVEQKTPVIAWPSSSSTGHHILHTQKVPAGLRAQNGEVAVHISPQSYTTDDSSSTVAESPCSSRPAHASQNNTGRAALPGASWGTAARWAMLGSLAGAGLGWTVPRFSASPTKCVAFPTDGFGTNVNHWRRW